MTIVLGNRTFLDGYIGVQTDSPSGLIGLKDANTYITVDASNNLVFADVNEGERTLRELINHSVTTEDFTITIDSGAGSDPANDVVITTQAEATAQGSFATISAAVNAIPSHLRHAVTLSFVDGGHTLEAIQTPLGDLSRFSYASVESSFNIGRIIFTSASGLVIADGTVSMDVTSSTGNIITLDSVPSLTADTFQNYMLVVTGGTGSGQVIPIRTHTGTSFEVARTLDTTLDGTSTVEIQSAAAQLNIPSGAPGTIKWRAQMGANLGVSKPALIFDAIDIIAPAGGKNIRAISTSFEIDGGSRFLGIGFFMVNAALSIKTCSIDARGERGNIIVTDQVCSLLSNFTKPWLIRGATEIPIRLLGGGNIADGVAQATLFGGTIDGVGLTAIEANGNDATLSIKVEIIRGTGHTYALRARNGGTLSLTRADAIDADYISGSVNDIILGDTGGFGVDIADIDADPNDTAIGPDLSKAILQT